MLAISILLVSLAKSSLPSLYDAFTGAGSTLCLFPHHTRNVASRLLEVFQVYPPILAVTPDGVLEITDGSPNATVKIVDSDRPTCQEVLAIHSFALSYGAPFVGEYNPPSCSFNRVTWNLTVVSAGRQFDRLGTVFLGDVEVFRTSTAEPTTEGIEWTYLKDMTSYLSLFKSQQKIIFDLGNLINDVYTAAFNVTLTASFFNADDSIAPADIILPVSTRDGLNNGSSLFQVPPQTASNNLTLPRNIRKAVFTIAATGQDEEEFWWSNALQSDIDTFPEYGELYGYSPFREIQLYIDGMLAGVAWPFPIIFMGGVVPALWRPIVGIDAFDLKEDEIDITPWLPLLCDGNAHNFTIRVSGFNDDGNGTAVLSETTNSYWWVTGKLFIWLDSEGHITTGQGPHKVTPAPEFTVSSSFTSLPNGTNETLVYQVNAQRSLSFYSTINLSAGKETATWRQDLSFSNEGNFSDDANIQVNHQLTQGHDSSSSGYAREYIYPLYAYSITGTIRDNLTIEATVNRGKNIKTLGQPVFPTGLESFSACEAIRNQYNNFQGAWLSTNQSGTATYLANQTAKTSYGFGTTEQDMIFRGIKTGPKSNPDIFPSITGSEELFYRHVEAVNGTVIDDEETLINQPIGHASVQLPGSGSGFVLSNAQGHGLQ